MKIQKTERLVFWLWVWFFISLFIGKVQTTLERCRNVLSGLGFGPDPARCGVSHF